MTECNFAGCKRHPRVDGLCSKHKYRGKLVNNCEYVKKDGSLCGRECSEKFCRHHCFDRCPNLCAYVGSIAGPCLKPCKKLYCGTHTPSTIEKRKAITLRLSKKYYEEIKKKKNLEISE